MVIFENHWNAMGTMAPNTLMPDVCLAELLVQTIPAKLSEVYNVSPGPEEN